MLRLIIGAARSGKTSAVMEEISALIENKKGGTMFIVPEQYSHEAERELSLRCGDTTSLYAEVLSFTGLARRILSECGGGAEKQLDKAGKRLCMAYAAGMVSDRLLLYEKADKNLELQSTFLSAIDELKGAGISTDRLIELTEKRMRAGGKTILDEKIHDIALIAAAYDAVASNGRLDPSDKLALLEKKLPESSIGQENRIYFDGFTDFTGRQLGIIKDLLSLHAEITVCLTLDTLSAEGSEIFSLSRECASKLCSIAKETENEFRVETRTEGSKINPELERYTACLFDWSAKKSEKTPQSIRLFKAANRIQECELAAAEILRLVQDEGARWKDIAIAARGFSDYAPVLRSMCESYGIPLFLAEKCSLLSKPVPALIRSAYDVIIGGWNRDDVISYMRTGLAGVTIEEADILEDYIFLWQLGAKDWEKAAAWKQNVHGWRQEKDTSDESFLSREKQELEQINQLRFRIARPLKRFKDSSSAAGTAAQQAKALAEFLVEIKLPMALKNRASQLEAGGEPVRADEYRQIWEFVCRALEQSAEILNDYPMDAADFASLFVTMLGMYDIATIPFSLDSVSAGDFDRMRRRNLRHLIILGADNSRLPAGAANAGVFSDDDRETLAGDYGIDLGSGEKELWREFTLIHNVLTLPDSSITLIRSASDDNGQLLIPSVIVDRARALFNLDEQIPDMTETRLMAEGPAFAVALGRETDALSAAAREWFSQNRPDAFARLQSAGNLERGSLSDEGVKALYGDSVRFTPSKLATFGSCASKFYYNCGMNAKPYEPASFENREIGTCIHYVLENVLREAGGNAALKQTSNQQILEMTDKYIELYRTTILGGFSEQTERMRGLFELIRPDIKESVLNVTDELKNSKFEPMFFELGFSGKPLDTDPISVGGGESGITVGGVADRVDGWKSNGKLYVRIADYKTGSKNFSLYDVYSGKDYQLFTYLRAVCERGEKLFGTEAVPAGIMYIPLKNSHIDVAGSTVSDDEINKGRNDAARRMGLVLDDEAVIQAWDDSEERRFIPLKGHGKDKRDTFISGRRLELLEKRVEENLVQVASSIRAGCITANPLDESCSFCDYHDACRFRDGENGETIRVMTKLTEKEIWEQLEGGDGNA